jgi:16S rRNA (guanine966-N2)-methyltransferase
MRIISGVLKGKSVNFLKNSITRPLKDSVKENIFNVLKHSKLINADIENADVLDLYSGVGSFGLECISRGAKKVLFVEQDKMAFKILKENLLKLSVENKASVINSSVDNIFENNEKNKFNFFFF